LKNPVQENEVFFKVRCYTLDTFYHVSNQIPLNVKVSFKNNYKNSGGLNHPIVNVPITVESIPLNTKVLFCLTRLYRTDWIEPTAAQSWRRNGSYLFDFNGDGPDTVTDFRWADLEFSRSNAAQSHVFNLYIIKN